MGGTAFPSASEPNPVAQGIRGSGPETIIPPPPTQTPTPSNPPSGTSAPPTTSPTRPDGLPYFFQDQTPGYVDIFSNGQVYQAPWSQVANQAAYAGYDQLSQLPTFSSIQGALTGAVPGVAGGGYQLGSPFGQGGGSYNSLFNYNPQSSLFQNIAPPYQPYSPFDPNASQLYGTPFQGNYGSYQQYAQAGFKPPAGYQPPSG